MSGVQGAPLVPWRGFQRPKGKGGGAPLHSRPVPETTSPESYRFAKFGDLGFLPSPFAQPFECPSLLVVSHRVPRSLHSRPVPETTNPESYRFSKFDVLHARVKPSASLSDK